MVDKETVQAGYEAIAGDYLAARQDSAHVQLLAELVQRLPADARVLEPGRAPGRSIWLGPARIQVGGRPPTCEKRAVSAYGLLSVSLLCLRRFRAALAAWA